MPFSCSLGNKWKKLRTGFLLLNLAATLLFVSEIAKEIYSILTNSVVTDDGAVHGFAVRADMNNDEVSLVQSSLGSNYLLMVVSDEFRSARLKKMLLRRLSIS